MKSKIGTDMAEFSKNADDPIVTAKADKFGRADFAKGLAEALVRIPGAQSFTVGLHGAWGSGKTSIIKMAEEHVKSKYKDDVIILNFNPWLFSSAESLHIAFFGVLAHGLGAQLTTKKERIADTLREYSALTGAMGGAISVVVPWAGAAQAVSPLVNKFFRKGSVSSANELKARVDKILQESNKRIVVIVDDIDRLDSDEIHLVFKLVKNVAHFSNITYLLAFDQGVVAKALAGRYPDEPEMGANFVEKIVQLSLLVPPVDHSVLNQFLLESVNAIADRHKLNVSDDEISRFQAVYSSLLSDLFTTPRKAIRYLNAIDFTFERLANEANFTDVMAIEFLRIFEPELYGRVSTSKATLIDRGMYSRGEDKQKQAARQTVFGTDQPTAHQADLIRELFPTYDWALGGSSYSGEFVVQWDEAQRVCSDKYFERYFNYGIPIGDVADAKLHEFLDLLSRQQITQDTANKELEALLGRGHPNMLVSKLRNKENDLPAEVCEKLAPALVHVGANLPRTQQSFLGDTFSSYVQSAILAVHLTRRVGDTFAMLKTFINEAPLDYAEQLLGWIRTNAEDEQKEKDFAPLITKEQLKDIGEILADRIKKHAANGNLVRDFGDNVPALMWIWSKWGSSEDIKAYLKKSLTGDSRNAVAFLDTYVGHAYDMMSGRKSRSEFRRESYNEIAKFTDPDIFVKPLLNLYGEDVNSETSEFPHSRFNSNEPFQQLVAKQFLFIHRVANREQKEQPTQ